VKFSGSSWAGRSPGYLSGSAGAYPVGVKEKTSTTTATINNSPATAGTRIPAAAVCSKERERDRDNRYSGAPYWISVKPSSPGALARTRLMVAPAVPMICI